MNKVKRERVVLGKSSMDLLAELNEYAAMVDCVVMVTVLPKGTDLSLGTTADHVPAYVIFSKDTFVDYEKTLNQAHIGFNKEDVLQMLLAIGRGINDDPETPKPSKDIKMDPDGESK